jgi:hypothetical protein
MLYIFKYDSDSDYEDLDRKNKNNRKKSIVLKYKRNVYRLATEDFESRNANPQSASLSNKEFVRIHDSAKFGSRNRPTLNKSLQLNSKIEKEEENKKEEEPRKLEIEKSYLSIESFKTEKVMACFHDEVILCECCRLPSTPLVPVQQYHQQNANDEDIFHLTSTGDDTNLEKYINFNYQQKNEQEAEEAEAPKPKLKDLLISNYDPKLAARIGVSDFVPLELLTSHKTRQRDLDFIPFENIDQNYPK